MTKYHDYETGYCSESEVECTNVQKIPIEPLSEKMSRPESHPTENNIHKHPAHPATTDQVEDGAIQGSDQTPEDKRG